MKKINMMPITIASLYFSYAIVIFGLVTSMWLLIFKFSGSKSVLLSFSILIASLFLAIVLRVFGNIGQILFDLKNLMQSFRKSLEEAIEKSDSSARDGLQNIKSNLEQINCDSKDINQYIHQIQTFFEQIAKHLELKK